jgi:hypothetical protein
MKRVAFCDGIMPDLYLGHAGAYNKDVLDEELRDRIEHNLEIMDHLGTKYDLVKYPKINPPRIKKDYLDALITYINEKDEYYPAKLEDIRTAKFENPSMKILAYTEKEKGMDYNSLMKYGIDDVLWRDAENYDEHLEIICKWIELLEEYK